MNVNLNGARSQARLDWDAMELRSKHAQDWPRRVFFIAAAPFVAHPIWTPCAP
jgi:hypothetical protein